MLNSYSKTGQQRITVEHAHFREIESWELAIHIQAVYTLHITLSDHVANISDC